MYKACARLHSRSHRSVPLVSPCIHRRYQSQQPPAPPKSSLWRKDTDENQPAVLIEDHFTRSTMFTFNFFKRLVKYSFVGIFTLGVTGWTAFEGVHMWVEKMELAPDRDSEVRQWEWDADGEKWTGGGLGGTDPGLGFKGRHAVRSSWIAQNWGTGSGESVITPSTRGSQGGLNVVETRLEIAQNFLSVALNIAVSKMQDGKLRPGTIGELLYRRGAILERMGTADALCEARSQYERVWAGLPGKGIDTARTALKLGDLNYRLGDTEDALAWWKRTLQLTQGSSTQDTSGFPIPQTVPSSPSAQRTIASALVSVSAYYATSNQLKEARAVQESALDFLRSIPSPSSLTAASPPQALHALYLLHRSSLLSIHLAEVLYALRSAPQTSVQWLTRAAESSERVALALTGLPFTHPDATVSKIPHPPASEASLIPVFTKSTAMKKPATSLLRDARRTAAEAWNLLGLLREGDKDNGMEKALECYERALGWAGVAANPAKGGGEAGEGTSEKEWKVLWGNYVRAREATRNPKSSN
ncbi:hypothetical protein BJ138DRAFT_1143325 [Hygrophoropsis aurantiaca]|uniref:Uncharacterized protein n=1 Tax=Hygrophoropsis aurantiaca TaxID=72124 RepID=A0ACB8AN92_9AGAM|nr:hypothetical protein BJ138DRAFT_1143325 [Hygrophoropsis aurantiaca]